MTYFVSPSFTAEKLVGRRIEDMIDVFEDQVRGWIIDPANCLRGHPHAGFAILGSVLSYFEPIGQFVEGRKSGSKRQFGVGLFSVFPGIEERYRDLILEELYEQVRCGLFHQAMTKAKVIINPGGHDPVEVHGAADKIFRIVVAPVAFIDAVERHLTWYVGQLRNPENVTLRANFENWFIERGVC